MNVVQQFYQLLQTELQTLRALPSAQGDPRASSTASAPTAQASDFLCGKCGLPGPPQESRQGRLRLLGLQRLPQHRLQD